jgi:carboxymethylenebutenolidase
MKNIRKEEISQEVFDLYDDYAHNRLDRRQFIDRLSIYAVGGLTVTSLLSFIMPNYKDSLQIRPDDPRLNSDFITYKSPEGGGEIRGLLSKPADTEDKLPGIVVVHENRGLNPHIEDVGRRAGLAGFVSLAPDALTPLGGYPGNDDDGRTMQRSLDREKLMEDFFAGYEHLVGHENHRNRPLVVLPVVGGLGGCLRSLIPACR